MKRFAILLALVLGAGAAAAPASAATGGWTIQPSPATAARNSNFASISCGSPSFCVAVGSYVAADGSSRPYANVGSGSSWTASYPANPAAGQSVDQLTDVSCASSSSCVAVGSYGDVEQGLHSIAEFFDGARWHGETDALRTAALTSVACPSTNLCVAATGDQNGSMIETRADGQWTKAFTAAVGVVISDVSCRDTSSCVAAGVDNRTGKPYAVTYNGHRWSVGNPVAPAGSAAFVGVSCVATICTAVGSGQGGRSTLVETWNGTRWTLVPSPDPSRGGSLLTVSCASADSCVAVGTSPSGSSIGVLFTEVWDGTAWTLAPGPKPDPTGSLGLPLVAVSCPTTSTCVLAAARDSFAVPSRGYLSIRSAGAWTHVAEADATGTAMTDLTGVSCTASTCFAVGNFGGAGFLPLVYTRRGARWVPSLLPLPADRHNGLLNGISCLAANFCIAVGTVDNLPASYVWDGTDWAFVDVPVAAGYTGVLGAVSCISATMCLAVGGKDNATSSQQLVVRFDGSSWSAVAPPYGSGRAALHPMTGVSCATARMCVVVGLDFTGEERGYGARWNGTTWTIAVLPETGEASSVSCSSTTWCVAAGDDLTYGEPALVRFNGSTWAPMTAARPSGNGYLSGVSCVSETFCAAVGSGSTARTQVTRPAAEVWDGSSWHNSTVPFPEPAQNAYLNAVDCPSANGCAAAGVVDLATSLPLLVAYPA